MSNEMTNHLASHGIFLLPTNCSNTPYLQLLNVFVLQQAVRPGAQTDLQYLQIIYFTGQAVLTDGKVTMGTYVHLASTV